MVAWSPERIKRELDWSHYDDGRAKGHVAFVNPSDFLKATTKNKTTESQISSDAGDLDEQKLKETSQSPFLRVRNGKIFDHEGRHRMSALAAAGHTSVPVILWHDTAQKLQPVDETTLKAQHPNRPALNVTNAIPLHRDYQDQIEDAMSDDRLRFRDGGDVEGYIPHDDPRRAQNLEAFEPIKDESGQPIKLFHNTNRDFSKFNTGSSELGAHFGTANQAANLQANQDNPLGNRRTMAVHLRLKNPLRLMDQGGFSVERVAQQLYDMDMINEKKYDKHMEGDFRSEEAAIKDLQSTIQKAGYDGIVYLNRREGLSQHPDPEINQKNLMWHFAMSSRATDDEFKQKFPEAEDSYIAFQPTQIKSATGNQGTFDPSNPDITKADGGALSDEDGITAYHGSPHDFEQFDTSKIGTGEGAQVYGHGLYFAGNENVARNYRDRLGRQEETSGETMADQYVIPRHFYQDTSEEELAENMKEAARWSEQQIFDQGKMHYVFDDGSMLIHDDDEVRAVQKNPGHMYEVHINAHPDHFLDWDTPLNQQSDHVQNAVKQSLEYAKKKATTPEQRFSWSSVFKRPDEFLDYTGSSIQNLLGRNLGLQDASDALAKHGIKGIRYLDAGSRDAGEGSRNYVVFDHNDVAVKRKYARGGMVDEARQKKANGGVSYSGDFTTPQYAQLYYEGLPQLGAAGHILGRLFPNPTTTGAYNAFMNANKPTDFTPISPTSFQKTDSISVPAQKPIGGFSGFGYSPMPSFDYFSKPSFNDWQPNNQASDWGDEPLPEVPAALQRFNAPAPQQAPPQQATPQQAAPQQAAAAPAKAPQGKKHGGSIVERALMITSRKA